MDTFDCTGVNKEVLSQYAELWYGIKKLIAKIDGKPDKYAKDFMKLRFESIDGLPLNKPLKFHALTLIVRCVIKVSHKNAAAWKNWHIWRKWSW